MEGSAAAVDPAPAKRVLLVEDERDAAEPLRLFLEKRGHTVFTSANGREALASLIADRPDVVILDLRMPVMDGAEFLEVVRSYSRWYSLPVILVTALSSGPLLDRALTFHIMQVFQKASLNYLEVAATVESA